MGIINVEVKYPFTPWQWGALLEAQLLQGVMLVGMSDTSHHFFAKSNCLFLFCEILAKTKPDSDTDYLSYCFISASHQSGFSSVPLLSALTFKRLIYPWQLVLAVFFLFWEQYVRITPSRSAVSETRPDLSLPHSGSLWTSGSFLHHVYMLKVNYCLEICMKL